MQETADLIRKHYRQQGYTEREIFHVDRSFDWGHFSQSSANLSLFSERKIIELRLSSAKLEEKGKKALQHYLDELKPGLSNSC